MTAEIRGRGRTALTWALRAFVPALPPRGRDRLVGVALSALGAFACFGFLITTIHPLWLVVAAAAFAGLHAVCMTDRGGRSWRVARALAWLALSGVYAAWIYLAAAFGTMLAWAVPTHLHVICAGVAALSIYSVRPFAVRPGVPLSLALGGVILVSLAGWRDQDGLVRCDDYLRAVGQPGVDVPVPTSRDLVDCREGRTLYVRRYPRALWESPDGHRFVFTTTSSRNQDRSVYADGARVVEDELAHSVCEAPVDGSIRPRCVGEGTAQTIMESEALDRLFVAAWGRLSDGVRGVLYEVPRSEPLRVLRDRTFPDATTEGFYDESSDTLFLITDEGRRVFVVEASTLAPRPSIEAPLQGGDTRYDLEAGEGMHCYGGGPMTTVDGQAFIGLAIRGAPFGYRVLGGSASTPTAWVSMSWGCDFDARTRRAWSTVPALGQLVELDYDSGAVRRRRWVGMGRRAVALDRARGRLYVAGFHAGEVTTIDIDSFEPVARHFVGRFARRLVLGRDGRSLFATSNLGIVRIELP